MGLRVRDQKFINSRDYGLGYWWMDGLEYSTSGAGDERSLLEELVADPWYQHDYASPRSDAPDPRVRGIHGPYRVTAITVESFVWRSRDYATRALDRWLVGNRSTPEATGDFRALIDQLLPVNSQIFELPDLGESARHEWGQVVGSSSGFLEFVAIATDSTQMNVLVATDD